MKSNAKVLLICRYQDKFSLKFYKDLNIILISGNFTQKNMMKDHKKIKNWKGDYVFHLEVCLILPDSIVKNAKVAAINFHPGHLNEE